MKLAEHWRVSTARLLPIYGALFAVWSIVLVGVVQWDTMRYLTGVVDQLLTQRAHYLQSIERSRLPEAMAATGAVDLRGVMYYGLFDTAGRYVTGNVASMPIGITQDGVVRRLPNGVSDRDGKHSGRVVGLALPLATGEILVLARSTTVIDRVSTSIHRSLLWGLSLTIIPGLIGGLWLARGPLLRVRAIEAAVQPIMRGNLRQRLPVSARRDELDLLAGIVNTMLDEIERLMGEVKGVCDSIAHDLRTPLTRVRTQLHRLQRDPEKGPKRNELVDLAIQDVDALLDRFRALLRISELEDMHRRAGFADVDLLATVRSVREIYAPVAEDKQIGFHLDEAVDLPLVHGDPHLLLEALSNIVDNAIKFTPRGGSVRIGMVPTARGPRIDVVDTGPGIPPPERGTVLQRFYRSSSSSRAVTGLGLGLSIVAAVIKLHGFKLEIADGEANGARISVLCWRDLE
ncbi:MAG TPA: HAMP domain-containing sensor histidine kinase [Steroidobacteraceae bacterium]